MDFTSLRVDQRGMVFIEAVLLVPLVALCLAGLLLLFGGYRSMFQSAARARHDAIATSARACRGGPAATRCPTDAGKTTGGWAAAPSRLPVLGRMTGTVLGATTQSEQSGSFDIPPLLGGGEDTVRYRYGVSCNEPPPRLTETEVVGDVACTYLTPLGHGPCSGRVRAPRCGGIP